MVEALIQCDLCSRDFNFGDEGEGGPTRSCLKRKSEVEFNPFTGELGFHDEEILYGEDFAEQHKLIIEESNNCGLQETQQEFSTINEVAYKFASTPSNRQDVDMGSMRKLLMTITKMIIQPCSLWKMPQLTLTKIFTQQNIQMLPPLVILPTSRQCTLKRLLAPENQKYSKYCLRSASNLYAFCFIFAYVLPAFSCGFAGMLPAFLQKVSFNFACILLAFSGI